MRIWQCDAVLRYAKVEKAGARRLLGVDGKSLSHLQMKLVLECFETPSSGINSFFR